MRRHLAILALAISLAPACNSGETGSDTLISVAVSSDLAVPTELDSIQIDVFTDPTNKKSKTFKLKSGSDLPAQLDLVPLGAKDATFTVTATGFLNAKPVVAQSARVSFVSGQARCFTLFLGRDCIACPGESTCHNGLCGQDPIADLSPNDCKTPPETAGRQPWHRQQQRRGCRRGRVPAC